MPIRITGMNSGLDTEALVSELVSAYRKKTEKYVKAQTKLTWKQDAWKSLSTKTYSFRTSLDSMRMSSAYKLKTTSVSNSTKATVRADNNAVNGSQSLNITKLAKAGYLTGGKLRRDDGKAVTGSTTLSALKNNYGTGASGASSQDDDSIRLEVNGKEIRVDGNSTVSDVVSRLQSAGVTASFDEKNQRIFVSAKESGAGSDFQLRAFDEKGEEALKKLGLYVTDTEDSATVAAYRQYENIDKEYEEYKKNVPAGDTVMTRSEWLEEKVKTYNSSAATIANANSAENYLARAAAYQSALDTIKTTKDGIDTTKISSVTAEKLLADPTRYVGGQTVYTLGGRDDEGRSYYTVDGNPDGTKYYLATEERDTTTPAKDADGNELKDENGKTIMEKETVTVFRTAGQLDSGNGGFDVTGADEYLKARGFTDESIAGYRSALSEKERFEADVEAEKAAYSNRVDELTKTFLEGIENPTAQQQKDAADNAIKQADAELKATGEYADNGWQSLEELQKNILNGSLDADAIKDAQEKVTDDREDAQKFVEDNAFFASYARLYAEAASDTSTAGQDAVVESMENDFKYTLKKLKDLEAEWEAQKTGGTKAADYNNGEGPVRVNGQDATIYLNGAKYTSDSNTFVINGLTITALATTISEEELKNNPTKADEAAITITTATDNQGIYDKIKDFLGEYNNLINQMTASYNAESAKEYEPLTDDEREAMTESQIEKWEEKGKSGVLRRDTTLGALMSTLTTVMSRSYEINGKKYSLSTFGIKTLGILNAEKNEQNAYHIDGDEDDENVSGNTDKLMAAIIDDPDSVAEFFQLLTHDMSMELGKKMSSTSMRTYGTFYNDKEMAKEYSDYTTTISKWEDKLADIEESYYKKFAAMEKALATLQSQSSQLAGLLGG